MGAFRRLHALVPGCAFVLSAVTTLQISAPPRRQDEDLARELAGRIAAVLQPGQPVQVVEAGEDAAGAPSTSQVRLEIVRALSGRGVTVVDRAGSAAVAIIACSQNLRDRTCAADVRRGTASEILIATRRRDSGAESDGTLPLALELRFVFGQRAPILDIAPVGDRLLVLDPRTLTVYRRAGDGWQSHRSQPLSSSRPWPRDVRGRLRIDGSAIDVFLPGATCRAALDSLALTCTDESQPWPIAIENAGLMPARNYFTTPEGLAFYGAAALGSEASAGWAVVGGDGRLVLLDAERRALADSPPPASQESMDDVAGITLTAPCSAGSYLVAATRASGRDSAGTLHLFRTAGRQIVGAARPVALPGTLTALWSAPGASTATAVVRSAATGRYEAFQIDAACDR